MTTVSILPIESVTGIRSYQAFSGQRTAEGTSAGAALDALSQRFPELADEPMIIVQRFQPDAYFSAAQQQRLLELMNRWRTFRDSGREFPDDEQAELEALVDAELRASGQRAADAARGLGK